jgi:D-arabinose 5-phosphate isomerase GutQ
MTIGAVGKGFDGLEMTALEPYLETAHFSQGAYLMREGDPGDTCYVITSGEVRIEVERPDSSSDGVVSYLRAGDVCGEFSVLDDSPRSASAYADTDVVARSLSVSALRLLCERDPASGISVLQWLSRHAAHKAREFSTNLQEFIFTDESDPEVDTLVASAVVAQAGFTSWSEADSDAESSLVDCARTVMLAESQAIRAAANRVADELHRAVEVIRRHPGKVVVTGIGKSGHVGRRLAATLCSTGTPAVFLHATEAVHGDLGVYVPGDPTILISNSGATAELVHLLPLLRSWNSPTIAIVGKLSTPLAEQADIVFDGRVASEADPFNLVPSCSTAVAQSLGNALALCLMRARGFTDRDFARCHPGGQLGRRLSDGEPVPVPAHREQR